MKKFVLMIVFMIAILVIGYDMGYKEAKLMYETELEKSICQYEELNLKETAFNSDFYYGEADIVSQEEMINGLIEVTWRINYSLNQCFITYSPNYLDENHAYLLTIYNNKTKDISDDEIAVIWQNI